MNNKHAYLIIAHEENLSLEVLIRCLDYEKNDIFIHVDKKTKNFSFEKFEKLVKNSKLIFIPRIEVYWAGYSQIDVEIKLLKYAKEQGNYSYYHLLSGVDLPLKTPEQIHKFFSENYGKEFVGIENKEFKHHFRVCYYHFEKFNSKRDKLKILRRIIQRVAVYVQMIFFIKRNKSIIFYKGSNWFSITDKFVDYVLNQEKRIKKIYKYTYASDEIFLQTLIMNSDFKKNIYKLKNNDDNKAIMRFIDWNRGAPYVWKKEDFEVLMNSNMLFARKFLESTDKEIMNLIQNKILGNRGEK